MRWCAMCSVVGDGVGLSAWLGACDWPDAPHTLLLFLGRWEAARDYFGLADTFPSRQLVKMSTTTGTDGKVMLSCCKVRDVLAHERTERLKV